tara:strand:+ start:21 stop:437 length:417 start_codon:yes stop_codon:yes gene_type:complete
VYFIVSLSTTIKSLLENASAKALATNGPEGINVVPVSMIRVNSDSIWLFDFFMNKTKNNLAADGQVALAAWTDMTGVQIKAEVTYLSAGAEFEEAAAWVETQNPERVTKGLLVLKPTAIYDVCPSGVFSEEDLACPKE